MKRYPWSDITGKIRRRKEECALPSYLFKWSTQWMVDFSLQPGVDQEGWQYAFDFPASYHAVRNPIKDFVRRRRWTRKCRIKLNTCLWQPISNQTHKLTSITVDQEFITSNENKHKECLIWATDSNGFVLMSVLENESSPVQLKWIHVPSDEDLFFNYISIGPDFQLWVIDTSGYVHYRYSVDQNSNYKGKNWSRVRFNEIEDNKIDEERFKQLSVGYNCVWAVSINDELFFRENISKTFREGTSWSKIDREIKFVTVNSNNQVSLQLSRIYFLFSKLNILAKCRYEIHIL